MNQDCQLVCKGEVVIPDKTTLDFLKHLLLEAL